MKKVGLIFSHNFTDDQYKDIKNLDVQEIVKLPKELQEIWSYVNPNEKGRKNLKLIKEFVKNEFEEGDVLLIQGEWGYTYDLVNWAKENGYIPVYSATERVYAHEVTPDGNIKNIHYFKHVCFKEY